MKSTSKILGIISFVINLIVCLLLDTIVFLATPDWIIFIIAVAAELLFLSLSLFFAIKSPKSKGCCIGLILFGVFTLFIFGILNIIGGAIGLSNVNASYNRDKQKVSGGSVGTINQGNRAEDIFFDATTFKDKKYYYPVNDYNLFDLVINFRNAPEISVRFDDIVLPLKIRLYINYGETVEDQTVAGFEVMSHFDLPMEKRTLIFQIVKDEQGKSALYWLRGAEDQELIKKVQSDTKRLFSDIEIGTVEENVKFNIRYGLDERIDNRDNLNNRNDKQGNNSVAKIKDKREINVGGTVLAVLSLAFFAAAIVCIVLLARGVGPTFIYGILICFAGFFICGFIGHLIVDDESDGFAYYATLVTFWIVYGVVYLIKEFIKMVNDSPSPPKTETVYYVHDRKYYSDRQLRQVETYCEDYRYFVGKRYNRFKDDLGDYWRSYDDNKTFIREDNLD